jgi:uncharacterized protein YdeI (YjbR/CyaY-like superfamily)
MMELYVKTREEWHDWLEENHSSAKGIWLIYYKKLSGKARIPYNDAVEEALCFGWIDGKIKKVNEEYYIQWFTPRRQGSRWSRLNISRAQRLIKDGLMKQAGLSAYQEAMTRPRLIYDIKSTIDIAVPDDLLAALKDNTIAYNNFKNFPPSSRRLYVFWLQDAKKDETRKGRIQKIVDRSEKNIRAGMI